jgi:RND family efflux transporter MFP subunit
MDRRLELTGEFRAWQQADLHAKVAGYLKTLHVDIGSRVEAGQAIAVLEAPELEAERSEALAAIDRAQSEEMRAKAGVDRAKSLLRVARSALERLQAVNAKEKGLVSGEEIDEATARQSAAEAELASAQASLESTRQSVHAAKARRERIEAMLQYTRISAPFSGVVTRRYVDPGNMVQAGTSSHTQAVPVVQIASIQRLRLCVVVPEAAVPDVRPGAAVEITIPALGETRSGTVARLAENIASDSRTMEVQIDVVNRDGRISPGMIAQVRLQAKAQRDVMAVPVQAIGRRGGQSYVLAIGGDGRAEERKVRAGLESATHIEVLEGLAATDRVVVGARTLIQPGQLVEAAEEESR